MPDEIKFTIGGADELARALESKPPIVARQILQTGLRKAVDPWKKQMVARVQRGWHIFSSTKVTRAEGKTIRGTFGGRSREFGVIARNIRIRTDLGAGGFEGSASVYPSRRGYWAKFLEFGTRKMRRFPFVVPAFESGKDEVLAKFVGEVRDQLHKEMNVS
jgi:HK97 gp10 family phage protein